MSDDRFSLRVRAGRLGVMIDAAAYYQALREAMLRAERSIVIVGWDVDGRTPLGEPGTTPEDGLPLDLRDFLVALVERAPDLHIHILLWDFTVLYSLDREMMPTVSFGWTTPARIHFGLDDALPLGAAQHEKVVVVDGRVAFTGGLDVALNRWDTPDHAPDDSRRRGSDGVPYQAFHDLQLVVDGPAAGALFTHVRDRWRRATRLPLTGMTEPPSGGQEAGTDGSADLWPSSVSVALRDVSIGVSRTLAPYDGEAGVQEIQALYVDAIGRAQRWIYIENQYLTAGVVAEALAARLDRPDPPEVVIVTSGSDQGWLEATTMGAGRVLFLDRLRDSGAWDKVRVLAPWVGDEAGQHHDTKVHTKLMIVDGRLVTVGTANLANRSMGLDCELNLTVESTEADGADDLDGTEQAAQTVAGFAVGLRNRLLGEHTGVGDQAVAAEVARAGSLLAAVDALTEAQSGRGLRPVPVPVPDSRVAVDPLLRLGDPERPLDLEHLIPAGGAAPLRVRRKSTYRRVLVAGLLVALIGGVAVLWRATPLRDWVAPEQIEAWITTVQATPWAPLVVLGLYVALGLVVFPVTVLIAGTGLVFGPGLGFLYALTGSLLAALAAYGVGHLLGKDLIRRYAGSTVNRLSRRMGRYGVVSVVVLRIAPVAPFTIINLIAGASHVRAMDFLVGTVLGMAPGIALMTIFGTQLADLLSSPGLGGVLGLVAVLGAWLGGGVVLQRAIARRRRKRREAGGEA